MAMLLVTHPPTYEPERKYIYDVILGEFLGFSYQARIGDHPDTTEISVLGDSSGRSLIVHEALFTTAADKWLTEESLPRQPLEKWVLPDVFDDTPKVSSGIPVLYGKKITNNGYYAESSRDSELGLDVFGSTFFMLTRYEEMVKDDRDKHDRFPAKASIAYQEGFLRRPITNEYVEILWNCMKRLWPSLKRQSWCYSLQLTHDVDYPLAVVDKSWQFVLRSSLADVIKRKSIDLACRRIYAWRRAADGNFEYDPFNTFDFLMDVSENHGIKSAFYFTAHDSCNRLDSDYSIDDPWIRRLLVRISDRGHEIGFHGSYSSYSNLTQVKREVERLKQALREESIDIEIMGGRQHYLRWECPTTWMIWNEMGMNYDCTLAFADCVGFRCGTCYEYPVFSLSEREPLSLRERPLIIMERSLVSPQYMCMSEEEAYETIVTLNSVCKEFGGTLVLLWHNSSLCTRTDKLLYSRMIDELTRQ